MVGVRVRLVTFRPIPTFSDISVMKIGWYCWPTRIVW